MLLAVPKQNRPGETRCPLTPAVAGKLVKQGVELALEAGAGHGSFFTDDAFAHAGVRVVPPDQWPDTWAKADIVVTLEPPMPDGVARLKPGCLLIGMLAPTVEHDLVRAAIEHNVSLASLEFIPRTSRAQAMDVLSSQANIAGYKSVLLGAEHCAKLFPMMMTAAGTLSPAKVFVIGAGVAGLQAIATAKRLGAVVEAFDVRAATKEQIQSLGARFVELQTGKQDDAATGGYAKEQTEEERRKQTELMARHVTAADVVVATAAVFGKAPPLLIPADVVEQMAPGSVIVDLAASPDHGRGNCELTRPGQVTRTDKPVTLVGTTNLPALVPTHASQAYANNIEALLKLIVTPAPKPDQAQPNAQADSSAVPTATCALDFDDDILAGCVITHQGELRNDLVKQAMA